MYYTILTPKHTQPHTLTHPQDQQGASGQAGGQGGAGAGGGGAGEENPLTPTKEEAATALASLSAEDHEAAG